MSKEIATQKATEITTFKPSPKMNEYLDTAIQLLSDSPSKVSAGCGVSRKTWYRWLKVPGFEDWFYSQYKVRRKRIIPKLDEIGIKHAARGSYQYWEAMNRKVNDMPDRAPESQHNTQIVLNVPGAMNEKYGVSSGTGQDS